MTIWLYVVVRTIALLFGAFSTGMAIVAIILYSNKPLFRHILALSVSYSILIWITVHGLLIDRLPVTEAFLALLTYAIGYYGLSTILKKLTQSNRGSE